MLLNVPKFQCLESINQYFKKLNYDSDTIFDFRLPSQKLSIPKKGFFDANQNFVVTEGTVKTVTNDGQTNFGIPSNLKQYVFPGALIRGSSKLRDNVLSPVAFDRADLRYIVDLPGLASAGIFEIVPDYGIYIRELNRILNHWFTNNSHYDVNAQIDSYECLVHDKNQLKVVFGVEFDTVSSHLDIDFKSIREGDKMTVVHRFRQIYYTVSVEPPYEPIDLLDESVNLEDVMEDCDDENPPLLVSSVAYGREFFIRTETLLTDVSSQAAFGDKLTFAAFGSNIETNRSTLFDNFSIRVYVLGGNKDSIEVINTHSLEDVKKIFTKYNKLDKTSPAFPLTYNALFVKDNKIVSIRSSSEYIDQKKRKYPSREIELVNKSGFTSMWILSWYEVSYKDGKESSERKSMSVVIHQEDPSYKRKFQGNSQQLSIYVDVDVKYWFAWELVGQKSSERKKYFYLTDVPLNAGSRKFIILPLNNQNKPRYVVEPPLKD